MSRSIGAYAPNAGKPRHAWLRAVFTGPAIALALALSGCSRTPPEQALREAIAGMQAAAEARDAAAVVEPVAEDFAGPGDLDRDGLRRMLALRFLANQQVGVTLGPLDVTLHGEDRAEVAFTAATTGGSGGLLPDTGRVHQVHTGWRREGDDWVLVSARWD